jgi:hypothetical protein
MGTLRAKCFVTIRAKEAPVQIRVVFNFLRNFSRADVYYLLVHLKHLNLRGDPNFLQHFVAFTTSVGAHLFLQSQLLIVIVYYMPVLQRAAQRFVITRADREAPSAACRCYLPLRANSL